MSDRKKQRRGDEIYAQVKLEAAGKAALNPNPTTLSDKAKKQAKAKASDSSAHKRNDSRETGRHPQDVNSSPQEPGNSGETRKLPQEVKTSLKILHKQTPSSLLYNPAALTALEHIFNNRKQARVKSIAENLQDVIHELARKQAPQKRVQEILKRLRGDAQVFLDQLFAGVVDGADEQRNADSAAHTAASVGTDTSTQSKSSDPPKAHGSSGRVEGRQARKRAASEVSTSSDSSGKHQYTKSIPSLYDSLSLCLVRRLQDRDQTCLEAVALPEKLAYLVLTILADSTSSDSSDSSGNASICSLARSKVVSPKVERVLEELGGKSLVSSLFDGRVLQTAKKAQSSGSKTEGAPVTTHTTQADMPPPTIRGSSTSPQKGNSSKVNNVARSNNDDHGQDNAAQMTCEETEGSDLEYIPKSEEAARPDGYPLYIPWSDEERRILLKGMHHGWSNEKIAAELPSKRKRTPHAVATAKSKMKSRHPNGVPIIRENTPYPLGLATPSSSMNDTNSQRTASPLGTPSATGTKRLWSGTTFTWYDANKRPARSGNQLQSSPPHIHVAFTPRSTDTDLVELLLPIGLPEVPIKNATIEEVQAACANTFGKHTGYQSVRQTAKGSWMVSFRRSSRLPLPRENLLQKTIRLRNYELRALHTFMIAPTIFAANISDEPHMDTSRVVAAVGESFPARELRPNLSLQALSQPGRHQQRRIIAHFKESPDLMRFYIPVVVGPSKRWVHVLFEPLHSKSACWLCATVHGDGNICRRALTLRYNEQ